MQVHRKYFKWNSDFDLAEVKLGQKVTELLDSKTIFLKQEKESNDYRLTKDDRIWISEKNGLVNLIHVTRELIEDVIKIKVKDFEYPATEKITKAISENFERLGKIESIDDFAKAESGDYLILIFKDHWPSNLFIKRKLTPTLNKANA